MIIDRLLASGIKIWLRTQLQKTKGLKVTIGGKDRQIMTGYIPEVSIVADSAVYQDIFLNQVAINGINIRFNLNEIIQNKPFKLLEPISVTVELLLKEADLQASLSSSLFLGGLTDFWDKLIQESSLSVTEKLADFSIIWKEILINSDKLKLTGNIKETDSQITIITGLSLSNPQTLLFEPITILGIPELVLENIFRFQINLGNDVNITESSLGSNQLFLKGGIMVYSD